MPSKIIWAPISELDESKIKDGDEILIWSEDLDEIYILYWNDETSNWHVNTALVLDLTVGDWFCNLNPPEIDKD